ncbi:unnamed protein product, partial [Heterosigma akashiwo]
RGPGGGRHAQGEQDQVRQPQQKSKLLYKDCEGQWRSQDWCLCKKGPAARGGAVLRLPVHQGPGPLLDRRLPAAPQVTAAPGSHDTASSLFFFYCTN